MQNGIWYHDMHSDSVTVITVHVNVDVYQLAVGRQVGTLPYGAFQPCVMLIETSCDTKVIILVYSN